MPQAGHLEEDPDTGYPLLVLSSCPVDNRPAGAPRLWGGLTIDILPGTLASRIYARTDVEEAFNCNYELNPEYQGILEKAGMKISGVSSNGIARIVELAENKFYVGTGFIPQISSTPERPHPLIAAFLKAALS
jgi:CTP synthase (UTP-ammonia lyase)